jgi:hypothetical protein
MQLTGRIGLQPESLPADAVTLTAAVVVGTAAYFLAAKCLRMDELADALSRRRKTETQP